MLVLSRRKGETIVIGHDIYLVVVGISGDKVRLGIKAHPDVPVHRMEVYHKIFGETELEKKDGSSTDPA